VGWLVVMGGRTMAVDFVGFAGGAMVDFWAGRGREAGREAGRSRSGTGDGGCASVEFWMKFGMAKDRASRYRAFSRSLRAWPNSSQKVGFSSIWDGS
jgi:hypothetical protein